MKIMQITVYIRVYLSLNATGKELNKFSRYNPKQKSILEAAFVKNSYLNNYTLMQLTKETDLDEIKICRWFRDRRSNIRKGRKEGAISNGEYF